ncbi:hypothetical protein F0P96_03610 [Hymenobacter busanensis]|uniref:Uncharacterized protein n=1 Tax=Hymenobacter busanensis TaxID=2607656 RepID=A0A7L4ZTS8_9BACT|nr:hypothetical protein [Hymenobacter busanensis]KAA9339714.1 hypothetical protein F0P96_03610 [Hymenobacter busanensis]QHJ06531.1 hypothetical protein GUY19_04140 [Hymenobacter busanensis]
MSRKVNKSMLILATAFAFSASLIGCRSKESELKEDLYVWDNSTLIRTLPASTIIVFGKHAKVAEGNNSVLIIEKETLPLFKPEGREIMDLASGRNLLIELSAKDSLITPTYLGHSKIYREILGMTPRRGLNNLIPNESIQIKKLSKNRWKIISNLYDFEFDGEFFFANSRADSSSIKSHHKQLL